MKFNIHFHAHMVCVNLADQIPAHSWDLIVRYFSLRPGQIGQQIIITAR